MGHRSPSHQWDVHRHNWFLLILVWARGTGINLKVLHEHLLLHRQAREARAWVEDRAHRPGLQWHRGMSTPLQHRLRLQINL